jgi:methylthioribose-1-phosphate isomerase
MSDLPLSDLSTADLSQFDLRAVLPSANPVPRSAPLQTLVWKTDHVMLLDQTQLPQATVWQRISSAAEMAEAIRAMWVRGAPAIGVAASYGLCLGAQAIAETDRTVFLASLGLIAQTLRETRPTAVNLFWAIDRMMAAAQRGNSIAAIRAQLLVTARLIETEDIQTCQAIGLHGLGALPKTPTKLRILTHCNTGALATAGHGTALGIIRTAWAADRLELVYADETRPRLQGAKLTAWECVQEGIPVTVITDSMAAHCMQRGLIDAVIVGADRIALNGDSANKIGTYGLAIVARAHGIPFYVAAPLSTVDFSLADGGKIPIEERDPAEIYRMGTEEIYTPGTKFYNPAFDVTPAELITAIVTEKGAIEPGQLAGLRPE